MKIYKVIVRNNYSHPMFFLVNSISEIEKLYREKEPEGSEIVCVEFLGDNVTVGNDIIV